MNSDELIKYGLGRVLGFYMAHPIESGIASAGIYTLMKNPYTKAWLLGSGANFIQGTAGMAKQQAKLTWKHLVKPASKHIGKKIAQRYAAAEAASLASSSAFAFGVGGAVFSLALMGIVIAEGEGQSGIEMAEGRHEYEIHSLRTGGGRQVVW